jgi:hypothetical protein
MFSCLCFQEKSGERKSCLSFLTSAPLYCTALIAGDSRLPIFAAQIESLHAQIADLRAKFAAADDALRQATSAWEIEKKELCDEMDERSRAHKSVVAEKQAQQSSYDEAAAAAAHERARLAAQACGRMQSNNSPPKTCHYFTNCNFSKPTTNVLG